MKWVFFITVFILFALGRGGRMYQNWRKNGKRKAV